MAPFSKKRKEPSSSQSCTLIDFFSNNAPTKKSKLQRPPSKTDKNSENVNAREIIIIDSDSDDYSPKRNKAKEPAEGGKGSVYCAKQCEWKPSQLAHAAPSSKLIDDGLLTFGRPSTLLQAPVQSSVDAVACKKTSNLSGIETTSTTSIFGVPTSLLRSSVDPASDPPLKNDHGETFMGDGCTLDHPDVPTPYEYLGADVVDIDLTCDDEQWGAGDDELAALKSVDDDIEMEDVSEQLNDYAPSSHSASCPVCECDLSRLRDLVSDMTAAGWRL